METTVRLTGLEPEAGRAAVSAARLETLAGFAPAASENLLVGLAPADDAAVYKLDDERALIVDRLRPRSTIRALFGAVAAVNALNDVFAMGGKRSSPSRSPPFRRSFRWKPCAIFEAAAEKVEEAGALLAGGHTIRDDEPKYGLAVGTAHPQAIWRNNRRDLATLSSAPSRSAPGSS